MSVAGSLPTRPIVIGHSMGGFVVQNIWRHMKHQPVPTGVRAAARKWGLQYALAKATPLALHEMP